MPLSSIRIDKWLWAARFFKTRNLARAAVSAGQVHLNGHRVKPARAVVVGDELLVTKGLQRFELKIEQISDKRGSASIAQALYDEFPESAARRAQEAEQRRMVRGGLVTPNRRPEGRDRKAIRRLKQRQDS